MTVHFGSKPSFNEAQDRPRFDGQSAFGRPSTLRTVHFHPFGHDSKISKILKLIFRLKLKDACVENSIFSKVSLYLKPVGLLITIFLTKWTVKNPIGTFLFTIPFYTLTCGLSCLIIKYAEVSLW